MTILFACVLALGAIPEPTLAADSAPIQRILGAWNSAARASEESRGRIDSTLSWGPPGSDGKEPPQRTVHAFKRSQGQACQHTIYFDKNVRDERVTAINSKYGFQLRRGAEGAPWRVDYIGSDVKPLWKAFHDHGLTNSRLWLYVEGKFLPDLVRSGLLQVVSVKEETDRIELAFKCKDTTHGNQPWWVNSGTLTLNKDAFFTVRAQQLNCPDLTISVQNTYQHDAENRPILVSSVMKNSAGTTHAFNSSEASYGLVDPGEFTSEHYGFNFGSAEPEEWNRALLALNVFAVALIVAGLALRRRVRARALVDSSTR